MALTPFDDLIRSKGIRMIHARPIPCPFREDLYSEDHNPACSKCHNGYIYYGHKEFIGVELGNTINKQFGLTGTWDVDQAQIIVPTKYKDGTPMDVQYYDQIVIPDTSIRYYQLVQHHQSGVDRLHFNATSVDFVQDKTGQIYQQGVDYEVFEGRVRWLTGNRPPYDIMTDRGAIYSVNYYCAPVFTIISLPHQFRATQTIGPNGVAVQERFPQVAVARKDFLPRSKNDHIGPSDAPEPDDGSA